MYSGFSERTFEFCYNAEFCRSNNGILATHPSTPSQAKEKDLGYDVEFQLFNLGTIRSLFLQHKIVHYAGKKAGRNARFFNAHNGPYYRFVIDSEQHNVLHELSTNKGNAYYCAPLLNTTTELRDAYEQDQICARSVWLDPQDVGQINDQETHHVTLSPNGQEKFMHSDVRQFTSESTRKSLDEDGNLIEVSDLYFEELADVLIKRSAHSERRSLARKDIEKRKPVEVIQELLAKVYDVSWIAMPA